MVNLITKLLKAYYLGCAIYQELLAAAGLATANLSADENHSTIHETQKQGGFK